MQIVPLIRMRMGHLAAALPLLATLYDTHKASAKGAPDFLTGFVMEWTANTLRAQVLPGSNASQQQVEAATAALLAAAAALKDYHEQYVNATAVGVARNNYAGFRIPAAAPGVQPWQPRRLQHLPTRAEFAGYVRRREPFVISLPAPVAGQTANGSATRGAHHHLPCPQLAEALGWGAVCRWDVASLCAAGGDEEVVLMKRSAETSHFGITGDPRPRTRATWCAHVRHLFDAGRTEATSYFDFGSARRGEALHFFPLHRLRDGLPMPSFLRPAAGERQAAGTRRSGGTVVFDVDAVSLWLGGSAAAKAAPTAATTMEQEEGGGQGDNNCGLHFDAMDNFHVMLAGRKDWTVYDPADAPRLQFIAPTNFVLADGTVRGRQSSANIQFDKYGYNTRFSKVGTTAEWRQQWKRQQDHGDDDDHGAKDGATTTLLPGLDEVRPASFTVEAGEALYLPWGWAHEVSSSGNVYMSITYWSDQNE
jgi:hypothetical protein